MRLRCAIHREVSDQDAPQDMPLALSLLLNEQLLYLAPKDHKGPLPGSEEGL
jgi:hypothetical protein